MLQPVTPSYLACNWISSKFVMIFVVIGPCWCTFSAYLKLLGNRKASWGNICSNCFGNQVREATNLAIVGIHTRVFFFGGVLLIYEAKRATFANGYFVAPWCSCSICSQSDWILHYCSSDRALTSPTIFGQIVFSYRVIGILVFYLSNRIDEKNLP